MTLQVVLRLAARQELADAARWYELQRNGLGFQFRLEVERAIRAAAAAPLRFPRMHKDVRCIRVRRFPYSVFFLTEADRLVVVAVFHVCRKPLVWQRRS